jgi:hypothetical protein
MSNKICKAGKTFFRKAKDAEGTIINFRKLEGVHLRTYYCGKCKGYHLTSNSKVKRFT